MTIRTVLRRFGLWCDYCNHPEWPWKPHDACTLKFMLQQFEWSEEQIKEVTE